MPTVEDVYCKFGFVAEAAQLLDTELGTLLIYEEAVSADLIDAPNSEIANSMYRKIDRYTLGRLIKNAKNKVASLDKLEDLLAAALTERNRLSHSFYREHNFRLGAEADDGRAIMLEDLDRMHEVILDAYKAAMLLSGIDLEKLDEAPEEYRAIEMLGHVKI
ncbi:hypothetical protein [Marinimicrobium alkaliphilum]|uniref:hypothetical protein n=1 Tax=Marinimicrobium alkaliphilum TaxID=2202654 RepID=UPI000DBA0AB3|nr:hypothetical protein [Marinimicrobium alkaliphilum]